MLGIWAPCVYPIPVLLALMDFANNTYIDPCIHVSVGLLTVLTSLHPPPGRRKAFLGAGVSTDVRTARYNGGYEDIFL